jgi:hypothetical protein
MTNSNHQSGAARSVNAKHSRTAHPASAEWACACIPAREHAGSSGSAALLRAMLIGWLGWTSACGSGASRETGVPKCVPGAEQACSCVANTKGVQKCSDDGTFGDCVCSAEGDTQDTNSTTQGNAPPEAGKDPDEGATSVRGNDQDPNDNATSGDATTGNEKATGDDATDNDATDNDATDNDATDGDSYDDDDSDDDSDPVDNGDPAVPPTASADGGTTECQELPSRFTSSTTLEKGCYHAAVSPSFDSFVTLTLAPGVTIVFEQDTGLVMRGGPALVAVGTAEAPILLTGAQKKRGFWQGVILESPEPDVSDFEYVTIEYAGADPIGASFRVPAAGLITSEAGYLSIHNSTIRESGGYGFVFDAYEGTLFRFENNTITRNKLGAGIATLADANALSTSSKFSGNDVDYVTLGDADVEYQAVTLPTLDVPYYVATELTLIAETLTLNPGTRLVFGKDAGLDVWEGSLLALGSEDDPIVFTGLEAEPGYWQGIVLGHAGEHTLRNTIVEYGGSGTGGANVTSRGLSEDERGTLLIEGSTLRHSAGYGLVNDGNEINDDYATVNTFEDNALGDTYDVPWEDDEEDG